MEKLFKLKQYGTNVRTEIIAGLTTFFTMAYIIFVNPKILSLAGTADNPYSVQGIFMATIIATVVGTLVMALVANVPYALAPGMGLNAFFTFTVCSVMGFTWQQALALVFICGIINVIITVTQIRKAIIKAIPKSIQAAIGGGIGLFIAYIGVKDGSMLKFTSDPGTYAFLGKTPDDATVVANSSAVPALVNFNSMAALLTVIGVIIMVVLLALHVKGAILIGIVATTLIGIPLGVTPIQTFTFNPADMFTSVSAIKDTAFKLDFAGLFTSWQQTLLVLITIISFSLSDTFDTIGTFIGTGRKSGIFNDADEQALFNAKGFSSRMDRALFADATATSIGALFGTSNTTTYVESSAGIAAGGRTGLTSVVTAIMFILCIPLSPFIGLVPASATAPALIVVGVMMMSAFTDINWNDFEEAAPVFLAAAMMPFAYSITTGISFGFIFYVLIKMFKGKFKEVHPIMYAVSGLFILNYVFLALRQL